MAHQEIQLTFQGNSNQILHLGPLELKGGETKYLPVKNNIASFKQLSEIKVLSVRKVTVADKEDNVAELGKDVVVKPLAPKKVSVTYIGNQSEHPVRGFGSFYKDIERELKVEEVARFRNDNDFIVREH